MINQEIQERLRVKYSPDGSPRRIHQMRMLEMLSYFDRLCKANGICYWLSSGTCLGAIRHNGFIPWDDDVDVEMLREDFLKLESIFAETDKYVLQTHKNDRFYPIPFAKMRDKHTQVYDSLYNYKGVFIDVFCLEYTGKTISHLTSGLHYCLDKLYNITKRTRNNGLLFFVFSAMFTICKTVFFMSVPLFRTLDRLIPTRKKLRHTYGVGWVNKVRNEKEILPLKHVSFESIMLPVPGESDKYLKRIYGDYMVIPDEKNIPRPHVQYLRESEK